MPARVAKRVEILQGVLVGPIVGHCMVVFGSKPFADSASVFRVLERATAIASLQTVDSVALLEKSLS